MALHGKVTSDNAKAKAEEIVRGISGVTNVSNLLQVVLQENKEVAKMRRDERELIKDVNEALAANEPLKTSKVTVKSAAGGVGAC